MKSDLIFFYKKGIKSMIFNFSKFQTKMHIKKELFRCILILWILFLNYWIWLCPSTVTSTSAIQNEGYSFSEFSKTKTLKIQFGSFSNWMYVLDYVSLSSDISMVIRKVGPDNSVKWISSFANWPSLKSLSVDSQESYVYALPYSSKVTVLKLDANTGTLVRADEM